jgi:hypothetical protein
MVFCGLFRWRELFGVVFAYDPLTVAVMPMEDDLISLL